MTHGVGSARARASAALLLVSICASGVASLLSAGSMVACKSGPSAPLPPPSPAVPAPASLFLDATLRDPDSFWGRVRSGGGGALMSLPDTAAGVVLSTARIDPRVAHLVAGGLPFHLALGEAEGGGLAFAIAMKVRDAAAARATLGAWDAGAHRAAGGMELLVPLTGAGAPTTVTALSPSGYLVIASSESDLATLGPYVTLTVPSKPPSRSSIEIRAAEGALAQAGVKATNLGAWATSNLLGLVRRIAPPVFDSSAFAACVNPLLVAQASLLADLADARLEVDTGEGEIHAVATLTPKAGDNAARRRLLAMHPADAAPLLETSGTATYAAFVSDTAAERADDVATLGPCFGRALGGALGEEGARTLDGVLSGWAKGRGDWDTIALVTTPPSAGIVFRAPLAGADVSARSLHDLTDLVAHPPVADAVEQMFGVLPASVAQVGVPSFGQVTALTFAIDAKAKGRKTPSAPLGLAWTTTPAEIDLAVGAAPTDLLASLRQEPRLGGDVATEKAVRALGADATFAAVLKPFDCCKTGGATSTPLTFGWGRHGEEGWSRVELGYELVARLTPGP